MRLREWQKAQICKIYDNPAGTRLYILSMGRKNAKTTLAAFLLLLHLAGPEAEENSELYSSAQSRDQAAIIFRLASKIIRYSPTLSRYITIIDGTKKLRCDGLGTEYHALSAEAGTKHGLSPAFVIHDELGKVKGPISDLYDALETGSGTETEPLSIIISTQAPSEADLLSVLIDDAALGHDPRIVLTLFATPDDDDIDPFSDEAIIKANPAFGDFLNPEEVRRMAQDAKRMPSKEAAYRNLVLNQRVDASSPFVSKAIWRACGGPVAESFAGHRVYGGLDLSECNDLTALVLIAQINGAWHVKPVFWLPEHGLRERAKKDRVPYDVWHRQGLLETTPGKSVEYEWVAEYLWRLFGELDIAAIGFDRWGFRHLRRWLLEAGFSEEQVDGAKEIPAMFKPFGQGFQSMSPALRDVESDLLNGRIAHGNHPVLTMCAANAVVQSDPAGNRKLAKNKSHGRIDGMVSLATARAMAATADQEEFVQGGLVVI